MIERLQKYLYILNKSLVAATGVYIVAQPPFTWVGTVGSSIMVLAALASIYANWTQRVQLEFISLWFVATGLAVYTGFVWGNLLYTGEGNFTRAAVASMALLLLAARGLSLWRLVLQINVLEDRINNNG